MIKHVNHVLRTAKRVQNMDYALNVKMNYVFYKTEFVYNRTVIKAAEIALDHFLIIVSVVSLVTI
jgi:hypothetical protein